MGCGMRGRLRAVGVDTHWAPRVQVNLLLAESEADQRWSRWWKAISGFWFICDRLNRDWPLDEFVITSGLETETCVRVIL